MNNIFFPAINKTIEFPSSIDELKPSDYLYFLKLVELNKHGKITFDQVLTNLVFRVIFRKKGIFKRFTQFKSEDYDSDSFYLTPQAQARTNFMFNLQQIKELFSFLFTLDENSDIYTSNNYEIKGSIRNFIPKIKNMYGPMDALQNISILEYIHAIDHLYQYSKSKDESDLNRMIAVLWRPKQKFIRIRKFFNIWNGDIRVEYNDLLVEDRSKYFEKIPSFIKLACYMFMIECDNFIKKSEMLIGNAVINLEVLFQEIDESEETDSDNLGFLGIMMKVAESGVFGNMKETSKVNLYDFLTKLYQNRMEYINSKSNDKKND